LVRVALREWLAESKQSKPAAVRGGCDPHGVSERDAKVVAIDARRKQS
jgi:hypothetical protein